MTAAPHAEFLRLFVRHEPRLMAWILAQGVPPSQADDVLQDAAVVLWDRFTDFEVGSNFQAWSFAIVRNMVRRHFQRQARRPLLQLSDVALEGVAARLADDDASSADRGLRLQRCLGHLAGHARELLRLRYVDAMTPAAIAEHLGVAAGSVRVRLHRIRTELSRCMEREL